MGKSMLEQKFEDEDKDLVDDNLIDIFDDFKIGQPEPVNKIQPIPVRNDNPYVPQNMDVFNPAPTSLKKPKAAYVPSNLDVFPPLSDDQDKDGSYPLSDFEKKQMNQK